MELIGEYALPENRFRREESSSVSDDSIDMITAGATITEDSRWPAGHEISTHYCEISAWALN